MRILPGQYYDAETGLYYNMARYYDPRIGRYISSDPIGLRGGLNTYLYADSVGIPLTPDLNTYSYAHNNPLRYIDPTGLDPILIFARPTPVIPEELLPVRGQPETQYVQRIQDFSQQRLSQTRSETQQPELPPEQTFNDTADLLKNIARLLGPMVKYLRDANLLSAPPASCPVENNSKPLSDKEWYQCYKMGLCL